MPSAHPQCFQSTPLYPLVMRPRVVGRMKASWRTWYLPSMSAAAQKPLPHMIAWFQISTFFTCPGPSPRRAARASIVTNVSDPGPPRLIQSPSLTISAHFFALMVLSLSFCCTGVDMNTFSLFSIFCCAIADYSLPLKLRYWSCKTPISRSLKKANSKGKLKELKTESRIPPFLK
ncbi:MAG: hypothetical protein A4E68_01016 [Syntrophaceae bacterium PtaB.Bin095]|nr:MAG: hypothetical protein A4E68_01016 [Syntrophaceae bacterium PtaB.Bin095]